jgi:hypothetical protein
MKAPVRVECPSIESTKNNVRETVAIREVGIAARLLPCTLQHQHRLYAPNPTSALVMVAPVLLIADYRHRQQCLDKVIMPANVAYI